MKKITLLLTAVFVLSAAYCNRGNAYYCKKNYDRAIADYNEAIKIDPNYTDAYIGRGNAEQAKRDAKK